MEMEEIAPLQSLFSIRSLKLNQNLGVIPVHFHREEIGAPIDQEAFLIGLIPLRGEPGKMINTRIGQTTDILIAGIVTETMALDIIGAMIEIVGETIEIETTIEITIETLGGMIIHQGK